MPPSPIFSSSVYCPSRRARATERRRWKVTPEISDRPCRVVKAAQSSGPSSRGRRPAARASGPPGRRPTKGIAIDRCDRRSRAVRRGSLGTSAARPEHYGVQDQADEEVRTPGGRHSEDHHFVREPGGDCRCGVQAAQPAAGQAPAREDPDEEEGQSPPGERRGRSRRPPPERCVEAEPHEEKCARREERGAAEKSQPLRQETALAVGPEGARAVGSEPIALAASMRVMEARPSSAPCLGRRAIGREGRRCFGFGRFGPPGRNWIRFARFEKRMPHHFAAAGVFRGLQLPEDVDDFPVAVELGDLEVVDPAGGDDLDDRGVAGSGRGS